MSANPNRRAMLSLLGAAPVLAAGVATPGVATRAGVSEWMRGAFLESSGLSLLPDEVDPASIPAITVTPDRGPNGFPLLDAQAIAATALVFPAEIEAYRSFAPHLKRRLYAEMLERQAGRLRTVRQELPPPAPSSSPGPGA